MDIKNLTVEEVEKLVGNMNTNYKFENKGFLSMHVDHAAVKVESATKSEGYRSRTLAAMVSY